MGFQIRLATSGDSVGVAEFAQRWRNRMLDPGERTTLVAEHRGQIAGFASVGPGRDGDLDPTITAELYAIYVEPASWRTGLGRALWSRANEQIAAFPLVTVWVLEANRRGRSFYESLGFALMPGPPRAIELHGAPYTEVRYGRRCGRN